MCYLDVLEKYRESGIDYYKQHKSLIVDSGRLTAFEEKYSCFGKWFPDVLKSAALIEGDAEFLEFLYTVYSILKDKEAYKENKEKIIFPEREVPVSDFAPLFPVFFFAEDIVSNLEKRGVPFDIIKGTLGEFGDKIGDFYDRNKRPGIGVYMKWLSGFAHGNIIRIDRFNIQMSKFSGNVRAYEKDGEIKLLLDDTLVHKGGMLYPSKNQDDIDSCIKAEIEVSDDEISGYEVGSDGLFSGKRITLKGYRERLRKGDDVLAIHIPAGYDLSTDYCKRSLERAVKIIGEYFPEVKPKCFTCGSWMISPLTKKILGRETNLTRFADLFIPFPTVSNGVSVYSFVFKVPKTTPVSDLPEDSSLQKAIKAYMASGNVFYDMSSLRFFD